MGRGGGRRPVAGDPVEAKKSPVGYPIGLLVLFRGCCGQYVPQVVGEELSRLGRVLLQFIVNRNRDADGDGLAGWELLAPGTRAGAAYAMGVSHWPFPSR